MNFSWCLLMTWREFWSHRFRLLFIALCMALGIGAYCATNGFSSKVRVAIRAESRTLLGGDVVVSQSPSLADELVTQAKNQIGLENAIVVHDATSMGQAVRGSIIVSRLFEIRALQGAYPLLGEFEAQPNNALSKLSHDSILVERTLASAWQLSVANESETQLDLLYQTGKAIKLAGRTLRIAGIVDVDSSREASAFSMGPRAYVTDAFAREVGIVNPLARSTGRLLIQLKPDANADVFAKNLSQSLNQSGITGARIRAHTQASGSVARPIRNINIFLDQIGLATFFIAVAGACLSAISYLRSRYQDVAILRCIGAHPASPTLIFMGVMLIVCACAALVGAGIGYALGQGLPAALSELLPVTIRGLSFDFPAFSEMAGAFVVIFSLLIPGLLALQTIHPLSILQANVSVRRRDFFGYAFWYGIAGVTASYLVIRRSPDLTVGLGVCGALVLLLGMFYLFNKLLVTTLRLSLDRFLLPLRLASSWLSAKQSLAGVVMAVLGLSIFLSLFVRYLRDDFVRPIATAQVQGKPNVFLADVQTPQLKELMPLLQQQSPYLFHAPLVRGRFVRIGKENVTALETEATREVPNSETENSLAENAARLKMREQNMTYRNKLVAGEEIVDGKFWSEPSVGENKPELSLEKRFASRIGATVGDTIEISLAGTRVSAVVTSLRTVTWQTLQPNFFIVAHPSLLSAAPQTHLLAVELKSLEERTKLQIAVAEKFPTVSVIDTTEVANRIWSMFEKIGLIADVLSLFIFVAALFILGASLMASRLNRARDFAILRALGATTDTLRKAVLIEFVTLGLGAATLGSFLALGSAAFFSRYVFEWDTPISVMPALASILIYSGLVVLVGWISAVPLLRAKPLHILQSES